MMDHTTDTADPSLREALREALQQEYGEAGVNELAQMRSLARVESRILQWHRQNARAEAVEAVKAEREAFLASPNLDPAWVAGWHAATDHIAARLAAPTVESDAAPEA